ncbi:MAG: hypothetical protein A2148_03580 [Chloroflexi bacterium RBG_16_68_14]|nr:MAG: hypothetical protein A2148_03580 [Chloroflexi bacterium RBG_16_68_14]
MATVLAVACGGEDGDGTAPTATPTESRADTATPTPSQSPAPTSTPTVEGTPTRFQALRDQLRGQLEAIGDNIGAIPDDIRAGLLARCHELEEFVAPEVIADICGAIEQAIEGDDPGLIDLVLDRLAELTEE